ncbi:MAG: hypothetical protein HKO59_08780 [Phycisphaerales bacterium]|nr:hypothetical protein [Phycisphaerales bacterium]NNM26064.1 hypothetical protein [Phycisphaerales bacterium]
MSQSKLVICPYCGATQPAAESCRECRGLFEPLSRQATHNEMGPWFLRERPHHPGCSYETLVRLVERSLVTKYSIVRGPTTKQFWTVAKHVPGVAHLLGFCHVCDATVDADAHGCPDCGVPFGAYLDRNHLGLPEVRPLEWESPQAGGPAGHVTTGARGLSSFAADEELLADHPGGPMVSRSAAPVALPDEPVSGRRDATDDTQAADLRLLRKRLYRQDRTIGRLRNVVVVVAIAAAALQLLTLTMLRGDNGGNAPAPARRPAEALPPVNADDAASTVLPPPSEASVDRAEAIERGTDGMTAPPELEAPPVETPPDTPPGIDEALARERDGANTAWPTEDRIRAYEDALAILNGLAAGDANASLQTRIERVEAAVERLRLAAFFP